MAGSAAVIETEQEIMPAIKQRGSKKIMQSTDKQANSFGHKSIKQKGIKGASRAMPEVAKEKTTFNLSHATLDLLEEAWMKLRRKMKGEQRITKTLIVEKAIELAIHDFETKSESGEFYKKLKS